VRHARGLALFAIPAPGGDLPCGLGQAAGQALQLRRELPAACT